MLNCSKQELLIFGLLDNALQQVDVIGESFLACACQGAGGQRTIVAEGFGDRYVTGFLKSTDVSCEIAVSHVEGIP